MSPVYRNTITMLERELDRHTRYEQHMTNVEYDLYKDQLERTLKQVRENVKIDVLKLNEV